MLLELAWLLVAAFYVLPPLGYILYMRKVIGQKEWNIETSEDYKPTISIIVPTFNEKNTIQRKLDDISAATYPAEKLQVIVIDSDSNDGTPEIASKWIEAHPHRSVVCLNEPQRTGKSHALNVALKHAVGEIAAISDAEALWSPTALSGAVKYLADEKVGAVTGIHEITGAISSRSVETEKDYRKIYSVLSIGESMLYSTPLFEGELALYRRSLLNGFPEDIGADDTGAALEMIEKGYRAIAVPEASFIEPTPYSWDERFGQKIRRGQHLLQAFGKYKRLLFAQSTTFHRIIFPMRIFFYVAVPILGAILVPLTLLVVLRYPWLLFSALALLIPEARRLALMNLTDIAIMLKAMLNEMTGNKQLVWTKMEETRI